MPENVQIVFVNGGMTFSSREKYLEFLRNREISLEEDETWDESEYLENSLEPDIIRVQMPCTENARYEDWRITFEKYIPLLSDQVILIGFSLGATFLAKYLEYNEFPKEIINIYLIAPPYDDDLEGEELAGGFELDSDLSTLEEKTGRITLMFSEDDNVVPIRHSLKFRKRLSKADIVDYQSKNGHFQTKEFPELIERIKEETQEIEF